MGGGARGSSHTGVCSEGLSSRGEGAKVIRKVRQPGSWPGDEARPRASDTGGRAWGLGQWQAGSEAGGGFGGNGGRWGALLITAGREAGTVPPRPGGRGSLAGAAGGDGVGWMPGARASL